MHLTPRVLVGEYWSVTRYVDVAVFRRRFHPKRSKLIDNVAAKRSLVIVTNVLVASDYSEIRTGRRVLDLHSSSSRPSHSAICRWLELDSNVEYGVLDLACSGSSSLASRLTPGVSQ